MIKTIIIEDEPLVLESLKSGIAKYVGNITIIGSADNVEDAKTLIRKTDPELVLLDIKLKEKDAFQLLDSLEDITFEIIFITAYTEYKEKAFDYFALHYLHKPIDFEKLDLIVKRFLKKRKNQFTKLKYYHLKNVIKSNYKTISILSKNRYDIIPTNSIVSCIAEGNYTSIHLESNKSLLSSKNLKHYEKLLDGLGFYRIHRSQLVNVKYIERFKDYTITLKNGQEYVVSKRNKKGLLSLFRKLG